MKKNPICYLVIGLPYRIKEKYDVHEIKNSPKPVTMRILNPKRIVATDNV
jgi:hypothetical protein